MRDRKRGRSPYPSTCRYSYPLDGGFRIAFKMDKGILSATWSPSSPTREQLAGLMPSYRAARNEFLSKLGVSLVVVEL